MSSNRWVCHRCGGTQNRVGMLSELGAGRFETLQHLSPRERPHSTQPFAQHLPQNLNSGVVEGVLVGLETSLVHARILDEVVGEKMRQLEALVFTQLGTVDNPAGRVTEDLWRDLEGNLDVVGTGVCQVGKIPPAKVTDSCDGSMLCSAVCAPAGLPRWFLRARTCG